MTRDETASTSTATPEQHSTIGSMAVHEIPGVTGELETALVAAGFTSVADVAGATEATLLEVDGIGSVTADVVRDGARYMVREDTHPAQALARETQARPSFATESIETLARYGVPPADALDSLRALVGASPRSDLLELDGVGPMRAHYLLSAGYDSIEDVATASVGELRSVQYLGPDTAPGILRDARRAGDRPVSEY